MDNIAKDQKQPRPNIAIIFFTLIIGFCICIICSLVGFYFFSEQFRASNQPRKNDNLILKQYGEDESLFGSYQTTTGSKVDFVVTKDGFATFGVDGGVENEILQVGLLDDRTTRLSWSGITIDGFGELSSEEQVALDSLTASDLSHAIEMIPLDIACRGEDKITAKQVAALLVPLQMQFKYLVSDRIEETNRLIALSSCNYGNATDNSGEVASLIQFAPSMPVPVVFGFFPFDGEGAIESPEFLHSVVRSPLVQAQSKLGLLWHHLHQKRIWLLVMEISTTKPDLVTPSAAVRAALIASCLTASTPKNVAAKRMR